ncbi:phosphate metabolism protein 7 [Umbelopsis nana]
MDFSKDLEKDAALPLSPTSTKHLGITKRPSIVSHGTIAMESEAASSEAGFPSKMTNKDKRPTMMSHGSWNPLLKIDALSTLRELYLELNHDIEAIQQSILSDIPSGGSAFITFKTQAGAQVAAQTLTTNTPSKLQERISNAASNDVMWKMLEIGTEERTVRSLIGAAISVALNIFRCIIVAFITSIATLSNLERLLPFLAPVINLNETIHGIIEDLAIFQGVPLRSEIERYVQSKYYMFLVVNVLLVVTIAGTVFTSIAVIIHTPTSIINLLATSLPTVSTFFINYLILQAFMGSAIELVQLSNLAVRKIMLRYFTRTPRAIFMRCHPRALMYGTAFPQLTLVFSIGMVFATIVPMVIIFAVLYYAIFYFVYLHQVDQYYAVNYQTAGLFYWKAMHHTFIGLIIQQLTVAGLFLLRQSLVAGFICLFILATTLFLKWHVQRSFDPLVYNMPLSKIGVVVKPAAMRCEYVDGHDTEVAMGRIKRLAVVKHSYIHPTITTSAPKVWLPEARMAHAEAAELRAMGVDAVVDRHVDEREATQGHEIKHQNTDASVGFPETFGAGSGFLVNLLQGH